MAFGTGTTVCSIAFGKHVSFVCVCLTGGTCRGIICRTQEGMELRVGSTSTDAATCETVASSWRPHGEEEGRVASKVQDGKRGGTHWRGYQHRSECGPKDREDHIYWLGYERGKRDLQDLDEVHASWSISERVDRDLRKCIDKSERVRLLSKTRHVCGCASVCIYLLPSLSGHTSDEGAHQLTKKRESSCCKKVKGKMRSTSTTTPSVNIPVIAARGDGSRKQHPAIIQHPRSKTGCRQTKLPHLQRVYSPAQNAASADC